MQGDANIAILAARSRALPVSLTVTEEDEFRRLVLGVLGARATQASFRRPGA